MPLVLDNETYYTATEAARYLHISRDTFYENVRDKLQPYQQGFRKRLYYRQSDLDQLQHIHPINPEKESENR